MVLLNSKLVLANLALMAVSSFATNPSQEQSNTNTMIRHRGLQPKSAKSAKSATSTKSTKTSKKSTGPFSFDEGNGDEVCIKVLTEFIVDGGPTTAISGRTAALFENCNNIACGSNEGVCVGDCLKGTDDDCDRDALLLCLEDENVIVKPFFFNRDNPGSEFVFTEVNGGSKESSGAACNKITSGPDSKSEIELWSQDFFETKVSDLESIKVDYKVVSQRDAGAATNQYFVNVYTRISANNEWYNCRYDFVPDILSELPSNSVWNEFIITEDTVATVVNARESTVCPQTLGGLAEKYPDAVIGVGNGELETLSFTTGETSGDYTGLQVCWDNIAITTATWVTTYDFEV